MVEVKKANIFGRKEPIGRRRFDCYECSGAIEPDEKYIYWVEGSGNHIPPKSRRMHVKCEHSFLVKKGWAEPEEKELELV